MTDVEVPLTSEYPVLQNMILYSYMMACCRQQNSEVNNLDPERAKITLQ
jgi:hypothetical protein